MEIWACRFMIFGLYSADHKKKDKMTHKARTTEKSLFFQSTILYTCTKLPHIFLGGNYLCMPDFVFSTCGTVNFAIL